MQITNFEATGLEKVTAWINKNGIKNLNKDAVKEVLRTVNISFIAEEITRAESTLLCELKDSYVQQSQRYVTMDEESYSLPDLADDDKKRAKKLVNKAFALYDRMSELKAGDFKGRPQVDNYKHGIPIEDAR
ncbi:Thymidylate synthase complementing protein [Halobacteroides halobius DSM 5150]|uniref:Thymidylate synthase complementing protein n=1 Tax=Halobacteroides halobius (strain ATCC 35273 / DSM 5150 / MD-1) TaxID=748449 RepID=L0K6M1_HALHC|nr:FAD-dependent thymidylate synthase [Halobacteroides halobius]AGB40180.1 Thymidylate synthase complementing protein [Halobacteroides halobius DSM 5150]